MQIVPRGNSDDALRELYENRARGDAACVRVGIGNSALAEISALRFNCFACDYACASCCDVRMPKKAGRFYTLIKLVVME